VTIAGKALKSSPAIKVTLKPGRTSYGGYLLGRFAATQKIRGVLAQNTVTIRIDGRSGSVYNDVDCANTSYLQGDKMPRQQTMVQRAASGPREAAQFVVSKFKTDACVMGGVAMAMHDILSRRGLDGAQSPRQCGVLASKWLDRTPQLLPKHGEASLVSQSSRN
jgi:hypothetical protein